MRFQTLPRSLSPSSIGTIDFRASFAFLRRDRLPIERALIVEQVAYHLRTVSRCGLFSKLGRVVFSLFRQQMQFRRNSLVGAVKCTFREGGTLENIHTSFRSS